MLSVSPFEYADVDAGYIVRSRGVYSYDALSHNHMDSYQDLIGFNIFLQQSERMNGFVKPVGIVLLPT